MELSYSLVYSLWFRPIAQFSCGLCDAPVWNSDLSPHNDGELPFPPLLPPPQPHFDSAFSTYLIDLPLPIPVSVHSPFLSAKTVAPSLSSQ